MEHGSWPEQIDRYRIEGVAGAGGMGTVLRATDTVLQRQVALKVTRGTLDPADRRRLVREARHLAALQHPHVVEVYDAGEADGLSYVAMRWVEGRNLAEVIRAEGPMAVGRSAQLVAQIAGALDAAHAGGLIHRDVKPSNVLLCGDVDHALLADFGTTVQQEATHGATASGEIVATADFAAPEQIEGRPVDARTDVYGLGCVAFSLLTGSVPYPRDSVVAALWAQVNEPPPSVRDLRPEVPEELDAAIRRAMAKDPAERFATAGAFAAAMTAAAGPVAQAAEPATAQWDATPARGRRRGLALSGVAALVAVAVVLAGLTLRAEDTAAPVGAATSEAQPKDRKERKRPKRHPRRKAQASASATATPTAAASAPPAAVTEPQETSGDQEGKRDEREATAPEPPREDEEESAETEWEVSTEESEPAEPEAAEPELAPGGSGPPEGGSEPPPGEAEPPLE
jgi:serine/threonine-protein kinase